MNQVKQYRKKPVVVEAMQAEHGNELDILDWINNGRHEGGIGFARDGKLYINTFEGEMCASEHDYIIKGVKGEFYPCKPDIFEATYEPVEV